MPLMLFAAFAARLAVGFVLRDGGETPEVDLQEALRVRQYLLWNSPVGLTAPPMSLLAAGFDHGESDIELMGVSVEGVAQAASLDDSGYNSVAATKSTAAMEIFVRRLLDSQKLRVKDETFMRRVLPYYTGECANQSFGALTDELLRAKTSRSCQPAWVVSRDADSLDSDRKVTQPYTAQDKERAEVVLIRGVMEELGAKVPVKSGNFKRTWQFVREFIKENGNLTTLQQKLVNGAELKEWINFETPEHEPTFAGEGAVSSWLAAIGKVAPLNEDGYRAVVYSRDEREMASFIRRVAKHEGFNIVNEGGLAGMTPYYSGLCARQTFAALTHELQSLVGQGFDMRFAYEATSEDLADLASLKATIAQRAGVDVSKVTVEHIEESQLAEQLNRYAEKTKQKVAAAAAAAAAAPPPAKPGAAVVAESVAATAQSNAPSMVAEKQSRPFIADNVAQKVDRKRVQVTISIDSAPKVHEIRKALKAASFPSGQSRASFMKADEKESAKPTQCGGGLLIPK